MWETAIQQGDSDVLKLKQQVQSCAPHSLGYCTVLFPRFSKLSFSSATPDLFFLHLSQSCDSTQTLLISSPRPLPHPSSEAAGKPQEEWRLFISQESSSWAGGGAGAWAGRGRGQWSEAPQCGRGLPSCREMPSDGLLCSAVKSPISRLPSYDSL